MVCHATSNHTSSAFFQTSSSQAACKSCSWGRGDAPRPCPDSALAKSLVGELSEAALLKLGRRMLELSRRKFELLRCRPELLRCSSDPPAVITTSSAIDLSKLLFQTTHSGLYHGLKDSLLSPRILQLEMTCCRCKGASPDASSLNMF